MFQTKFASVIHQIYYFYLSDNWMEKKMTNQTIQCGNVSTCTFSQKFGQFVTFIGQNRDSVELKIANAYGNGSIIETQCQIYEAGFSGIVFPDSALHFQQSDTKKGYIRIRLIECSNMLDNLFYFFNATQNLVFLLLSFFYGESEEVVLSHNDGLHEE